MNMLPTQSNVLRILADKLRGMRFDDRDHYVENVETLYLSMQAMRAAANTIENLLAERGGSTMNGKSPTEIGGDIPTTCTWYSFDERTPEDHGWILIADDRFATPTKALFKNDCGVDILRNIGHTNKTDADYGSGFDHAYAWTPLPPMPTMPTRSRDAGWLIPPYARIRKEKHDEPRLAREERARFRG